MDRLALVGGCCSAKTTVLMALEATFGDDIVVMPEVATMLLEGGFPNPGRDVPWSQEWQDHFQSAVIKVQDALEETKILEGRAHGAKVLVTDRGIPCAGAYLVGGWGELAQRYGVKREMALLRYKRVVHLESLATFAPELYGRHNNRSRFEPVERAQMIEANTRTMWEEHPNRTIISGEKGVEGKIAGATAVVRELIRKHDDYKGK